MTIFTDNLISWLCGGLFDSIADTASKKSIGKREKMTLEKELREFIERKQKEFVTLPLDNEFDFQGLSDYILNNMAKEVGIYLCGNVQQRESAQNTILAKAIEYSSALSSNAQEQVRSIIKQSLQIIFDFFASKIDILTHISSNIAIDEIRKITDNQTNELENCINDKFEKEKGVNMFTERLSVLKSIEKIILPDYDLDIRPKKKKYKNEEISESELSVLFSDSILNYYKKIMEYISDMEYLISDLLTFYRLSCTPDGEGGYENKTWCKILDFENNLSLHNYDDKLAEEFKEFCNNNIFIETIPELNESIEYNYFDILRKMKNVQHLFDSTKKELISTMKSFLS